ncbi:MAG: type I DNA topoisomerase [Firmicutes bacterium]|nr:type I DNA topoisomerase [Bacillota bacterium]
MKNLVIVESPSKSKTIEKYLGGDFKVVSSKGHIRDLATSGKFGLGIDLDNDFKPNYIAIKGKSKTITELKKLAKESDMVYLASDPDREGEAISWHLLDVLKLKNNYSRVVFNEITKPAVEEAFKHPRLIDDNLVKSQETRRMLDRMIGFRLSKLMQSKTSGKSAGRVQSVALKLIVDREREIEAFIPEEYWTITAKFDEFDSTLFKYKDDELKINNEAEANEILNKLSDKFKVESIEEKEKKRTSRPVFITSTLQQAAVNKLNYSASKTMRIAQKLYEGVDLGSETVGLITYMRTDSTRLSPLFIDETFKFIEKNYGKEYVGYVKKSKRNENVQDAHEGIRPTSINRTPESVKQYLTNEEFKVYKLIYDRALSSLMADSKYLQTTIILDNNDYKFKSSGSVILFDGFLKTYQDNEEDDNKLPNLKGVDVITSNEILSDQHFTKAPARYSESSLIKELESLGIGRPSTYATIIDTLKSRDYVVLEDKKFVPTAIGFETTDKLQEFFSNIINVEYTANMEKDLDDIAEDKKDNIKVLRDFWNIFEDEVEDAFSNMEKKKAEETGEVCPECGSPLVKRNGRYGEFVACSNYPSCKYIKKEEKEVKEICDCPKCGGKIIEKTTRKGKVFFGCSNYPKCKVATWDLPNGEVCPKCGELLVVKKEGIKCSSCDYEK